MKILIITQKIDRKDPILGFFHRWIEEFAKNYEKATVICLEVGEYRLPSNVKVLSLGKEKLKIENSKLKIKFRYIINFYQYIWSERNNYDAVFVHMNQEYVLLGWKFWKLWNKKIYLWRNHAKGSFSTRVAILFSDKVFYTSPQSYTAKFRKAQIMPVGIDTEFFKSDPMVAREPNSVLFLGRIAPVKRVLEFIEWFSTLDEKSRAAIAGTALEKDKHYEELVRSRASDRIKFIGAVSRDEALRLYRSHETYVNFTPSGSMDKTILEAAACETTVIVSNKDLKFLEKKRGKDLRDFVLENHSLKMLADKLKREL